MEFQKHFKKFKFLRKKFDLKKCKDLFKPIQASRFASYSHHIYKQIYRSGLYAVFYINNYIIRIEGYQRELYAVFYINNIICIEGYQHELYAVFYINNIICIEGYQRELYAD